MKKVFIIGKIDELNKDLENVISEHYNVQKCVSNLTLLKSMLNVQNPDLIIISLLDVGEIGHRIFNTLKEWAQDIPVICMGDTKEQYAFGEYLKTEQFICLTRPISNEEILDNINTSIEKNETVSDTKKDTLGERKKVLLVDDNPLQLRILKDVLKGQYDVQMATSGLKAISMLEKSVPDVIFLDYEMPKCDGKKTLEMIRAKEATKDIPVVFLTGVVDNEHIQAVLDLNPAGYLFKSLSTDRIFETLDRIFEED